MKLCAIFTLASLMLSCSKSAELVDYGSCADLDPSTLRELVKAELDPLLALPENFGMRAELLHAKSILGGVSVKSEECFRFHGNAPNDAMSPELRQSHLDKMDAFLDINTNLNWVLLGLDTNSQISSALLGIEHVWKDYYEDFLVNTSGT